MKRLIINKNKKRHDFFVDNVPLGSIIPFSGMITPPGYLECDGREISRIEYADLFDIIGTIYGEGNGASTFNIPDLRGRFLEGSDSVGAVKEAGLPNITGYIRYKDNTVYDCNGTFTYSGEGAGVPYVSLTGSSYVQKITMDASKSSSIYGNSETVQPPSITIRYIIKVFDANVNDDNYNLKSNFTIVYPNGGTKDNPANVTTNSYYYIENPFPGYYVNCIAEVKINNEWGITGDGKYNYAGSNYSGCVRASQFNDDAIVVKTGSGTVFSPSSLAANPFPENGSKSYSSLPCRIKVWKIGRIQ